MKRMLGLLMVVGLVIGVGCGDDDSSPTSSSVSQDDYSETIQITEPLKILQEEIEKDEQEKISQEGKDVFYAGTRNSNT